MLRNWKMLYCIVKRAESAGKNNTSEFNISSVKYFSTSDAIAPTKEWPRSIMVSRLHTIVN